MNMIRGRSCLRAVAAWLTVLAAALAGGGAAAHGQRAAQSQECLSAAQEINYVKEKLALSQSRQVLEKALMRADFATQSCPHNGDAWFYLSAVQKALKLPEREINYSRKKAEELESPALLAGLDPFMAQPPPRGKPDEGLPAHVVDKWALIVGVGRFKNLPESRNLRYAAKDANDFADALKNPNYGRFDADKVRVLTDEAATLANIRLELGWLRERAKKEDMVVIYFSSHGSEREIDPNGVSFIVAHDTEVDKHNKAKLFATSLEMIYLVQFVRQELQSRRTVLFLDTCYSGDATSQRASKSLEAEAEDAGAFSEALKALRSGTGHAVITSSRADEKSWEDDKLKNSLFTYYLIKELEGGKGAVTLDKMFGGLRQKVSDEARKMKNASQNPVIQLSPGAEGIVLGVPPRGAGKPQSGDRRTHDPRVAVAAGP